MNFLTLIGPIYSKNRVPVAGTVHNLALKLGFGCLALATMGTTMYSRDFVKLHLGPLYILEIAWLVILSCAVFSGTLTTSNRFLNTLWSPLLFFIWGALLLFLDVILNVHNLSVYFMTRLMQHGLLFVYPLMWMGAGVWAFDTMDSRWIRWLLLGILAIHAIPYFSGTHVSNVGLGPILVIPYLYFLTRAQSTKLPASLRLQCGVLAVFLGLLTFYPFFIMFTTSMQRSTLLILLILLLGVPWALRRAPDSIFIPVRTSAFSIFFLLAGMAVTSILHVHPSVAVPQQSIPSSPILITERGQTHKESTSIVSPKKIPLMPVVSANKTDLTPIVGVHKTVDTPSSSHREHFLSRLITTSLKSFQHGEDVPTLSNPKPFQFRTRSFMWRTAISDWLENPVFGVRFVPEIPSFVRPGRRNNGGYPWENDPPVTGPHNSYLSVLSRMGLIGLILLIIIAIQWQRMVSRLLRSNEVSLPELLLIFIPLNGAIYAFFNVGFESPHNCMLMWLFLGFLFAQATKTDQQQGRNRIPIAPASTPKINEADIIPIL